MINPRSACSKVSAWFRIFVSSPNARLRAKDLAERETLRLTNWTSSTTRCRLAMALIVATATIAAAGVPSIMGLGNKSSLESPSVTATSTRCDKVTVAKVCVENLTVQFNSNEPQQVKNSDRISLKAGDTLRLSNLTYCIPSKAPVNRVEVKVYLFPNGVESYKNGLSTPSNFPINAACHNIGNFQQTWTLEPGQHRVSIPIIKYVGSNRIVDSSFYLNLDVGR